jgi:hypothetical protein
MNDRMQEELDPQPTATGSGWMFDPAKLINMIMEIYGITPENLPDGVNCYTIPAMFVQRIHSDRDRKVHVETVRSITSYRDREVHCCKETVRSIVDCTIWHMDPLPLYSDRCIMLNWYLCSANKTYPHTGTARRLCILMD